MVGFVDLSNSGAKTSLSQSWLSRCRVSYDSHSDPSNGMSVVWLVPELAKQDVVSLNAKQNGRSMKKASGASKEKQLSSSRICLKRASTAEWWL